MNHMSLYLLSVELIPDIIMLLLENISEFQDVFHHLINVQVVVPRFFSSDSIFQLKLLRDFRKRKLLLCQTNFLLFFIMNFVNKCV